MKGTATPVGVAVPDRAATGDDLLDEVSELLLEDSLGFGTN